MIPFPGESLGVDYAQVIGGADVTTALRFRAGSQTLTSGDEWRAWVYPGGPTYLESGTPIAAAWAVEVGPGTVTLDASMGMDPMWGDTGASHGTSLGTHTVTGPATLVLSAPGITADDLLTGDDAPMLVLEATAGSAVVSQVKLRAWPPGGALGGWSSVQPGFDNTAVPAAVWYATLPGTDQGIATGGTPEDAWDSASAAITPGAPVGPFTFNGINFDDPLGAGASILYLGSDVWQAELGTTGGIVLLEGEDWQDEFPIDGSVLTEEVDYVRPPTEIQDDYAYWAQQVGTGSTGWVNATVHVVIGPQGPSNPIDLGEPTIGSVATDDVTITPVGFDIEADVDYSPGTAVGPHDPTLTTTVDVPLNTGGRYIVVSAGHTLEVVAWPGWAPSLIGASEAGANTFEVGFPDIASYPILPPYRVWDPNAVVKFLRVIQRGDGLGMGSGRVFGTGTRQASPIVFGTV